MKPQIRIKSASRFLKISLFMFVLSVSSGAFAQDEGEEIDSETAALLEESEATQQAVKSNSKGSSQAGVLDFEGELIEGQRKRPDLFLQTEIQNLTLDAILYLRKDFNDFHQVDRARRPGYVERKTRKRN